MAKYFHEDQWYTDLGRRIRLNDLFREVKRCLAEYVEFHKQPYPMPKKIKLQRPRKSWRCFHCDQVFTSAVAARDHFGHDILDRPACQTDAKALRALERQLERYRNEDTDLHRQIARMQTEHQSALMRADEAGYAKGLKDGREMIAAPSCTECSTIGKAACPEHGLASPADSTKGPGYNALWLWFQISRAGWLTIPRVLLHEMPDEWQGKMAILLGQYENTFTNWPEGIGTRVQITDCGSLTRLHNWLNDYRYPAKGKIEDLRTEAKK